MTENRDKAAAALELHRKKLGSAGRIARAFIDSKLTPLLVIFSLALGVFSVMITPREEEPQIQVPMIDVHVPFPGASAKEVEERVATPLEKFLWEIPGIDFVYTTSSPDYCLAIARFKVGENPEDSAVKLHTKLLAHPELLPPGAGPLTVKPKSIDDVPIVALTLWGEGYDGYALRTVADELALELKKIPGISEAGVIGGSPREVRVRIDAARLAGYGVSAIEIAQALEHANRALPSGSFLEGNREITLRAGGELRTAEDVRRVVVGVRGGNPIHLGEVADVIDGPAQPESYVSIATGPSMKAHHDAVARTTDAPAVTITLAKKPGQNAVALAKKVETRVEELKRTLLPSGLEVTWTRNYGETAAEKSNELIGHVLLATAAVVLLMLFALGKREAIVVGVAVPVTLALTLFASTMFGYTLNRVTLFALIFAIGILVDDAIVVVENIHRHLQLGWTGAKRAAIYATDEVGNPTILATFAVIAALLPLAFVSGLMGPYMRPIPINASAAMFFSLLVAFIITPWLALRLLKPHHEESAHAPEEETQAEHKIEKIYSKVMRPLVRKPKLGGMALAGVGLLLVGSVVLLFVRAVPVKMLPFDNKSEFQVVVDMPEGSTLEQTNACARDLAQMVRQEPEVADVEIYSGTSGPINFNGLVRHYFLRRGSNVADLQVNLASKHDRKAQSHDIAKRVRPKLDPIAAQYGARIKVAEVPPGPPVLSTLVAEIYGPDPERRRAVAAQVKEVFETTPGVVDVDWMVEDPAPELRFAIDSEKTALSGISTEMVTRELLLQGMGGEVGRLRTESGRAPVPLTLQADRGGRSPLADLSALTLPSPDGSRVPLASLVQIQNETREPSGYHKNLRPVTYVIADVAGVSESPVYGILDMKKRISEIQLPEGYELTQHFKAQPESDQKVALKWDGEWQITYEVFRDMGIAFAAVMVLVYMLVVAWFRSFTTPLVIMAPIPLTLVGILPGHWMTGMFFTATSMIGFIALSGIIVRNSILLVDFINLELEGGASLEDAVLKAGAVRMRPIVLTAAALVVGGLVIILDPIFQGLAVSLIFGVVVATALTLVVIPLLYYLQLKYFPGTAGMDLETTHAADAEAVADLGGVHVRQ
ncbi:MAG: efflux RND transporter permease subunit [Candidatus Eisenbacteria bacterium]|uniref:Efflux RND transporter permease subunit n=1 Tax=Eiseniibacteriota bacterium TaxID=2212470 RepID=A0A956RNM6_UNCEI|nr:efflux RND transporter permease subunit [Candidatus Eisenbacteria bacterium]